MLEHGSTVPVTQQCRDRGGSSLQECSSTATSGLLDTSRSGPLTLRVAATDGAGNRTTMTRTYTVAEPTPIAPPTTPPTSPPPAPIPPVLPVPADPARPDAVVRSAGGEWVGDGQYERRQKVLATLRRTSTTMKVRLENDGGIATDLRVRGTSGNREFRVKYFLGQRDVTRAVRRGRLTLASVASGERVVLKLKVSRRAAAGPGDRLPIRVRAFVPGQPDLYDAVQPVVRIRG